MAFDIRIKPLVLFDLEDKIRQREYAGEGEGRRLYRTFLAGLSDMQQGAYNEITPVYETVKKYVLKDVSCSLFYTISGNTILVIGLT